MVTSMPRRREKVTLTEAAKRLGTTSQHLAVQRSRDRYFPKHDRYIVGAMVYDWDQLEQYWTGRVGVPESLVHEPVELIVPVCATCGASGKLYDGECLSCAAKSRAAR